MVNGVMVYEDRQFNFDWIPFMRKPEKPLPVCGVGWMPGINNSSPLLSEKRGN